MIKIGLTDFDKEYGLIGKVITKQIDAVLKSGWYILGDQVVKFENILSRYIGVKYAVGVASGTDALTLAIKALGLGKDDGVLVPANVYPTVFGVYLSGVQIQLCDVDPSSLNLTLETIKKSIKKNTKAIVVVHLYGNPVDIEPIRRYTKKKNILLIEDCAQAIGSLYKSKKVGNFSDIACFSFYPTKNLGAYGDGGAILTNSVKLYRKLLLFRMYGEKTRYKSITVGHNSRLDEIQAAILRVKLKHLNEWNIRRREIAKTYRKLLKDLPIGIISEPKNGKSNYHLFVIKTKNRKKISLYLQKNGIASAVHYPIPIHLVKSFSYLGYKQGDFPVSEKASKEVLSLPMHPFMTNNDVVFISSIIKEYFGK